MPAASIEDYKGEDYLFPDGWTSRYLLYLITAILNGAFKDRLHPPGIPRLDIPRLLVKQTQKLLNIMRRSKEVAFTMSCMKVRQPATCLI